MMIMHHESHNRASSIANSEVWVMRMDQLERGGFQNRVPGEERRCRLDSWMRLSAPGFD